MAGRVGSGEALVLVVVPKALEFMEDNDNDEDGDGDKDTTLSISMGRVVRWQVNLKRVLWESHMRVLVAASPIFMKALSSHDLTQHPARMLGQSLLRHS